MVRAAWRHIASCQQPVWLELLRVSITAFQGKNFIISFKSWNHSLKLDQELPVDSAAVNVLEMFVLMSSTPGRAAGTLDFWLLSPDAQRQRRFMKPSR